MPKAEQTIIVNAPVSFCFKKYTDFVSYPEFMDYIKEIKLDPTNHKNMHWVITSPVGLEFEFDAFVTEQIDNQKIAWQSVEGSDIKTQGHTLFDAISENQTRLTTQMEYEPPAGVLGETVAKLFSNPQDMLENDLKNFKKQAEARQASSV